MSQLEEIGRLAEAQNKLLESMINDLQKDWTEDEKLQINDPKEWARRQKLKQPIIEPMAKELTAEAIETLKNSKVEGFVVKLPDGELDRKIYLEVKNKLELIGGKWKGGKVYGFVFQEDPTALLNEIANGGNRNLKKEFQFFGTPDSLCDKLVELAEIKETDRVLEPSAGQGAIIKAINRIWPEMTVECFELMPVNKMMLERIPTAIFIGDDFLTNDEAMPFDKIVANPPFAKNQDIAHIYHMFNCLSEGGRIVTIAGKHWQHSTNKKETEFREWLDNIGAEIIEVEAGEFKESGTSIATVIIIINK